MRGWAAKELKRKQAKKNSSSKFAERERERVCFWIGKYSWDGLKNQRGTTLHGRGRNWNWERAKKGSTSLRFHQFILIRTSVSIPVVQTDFPLLTQNRNGLSCLFLYAFFWISNLAEACLVCLFAAWVLSFKLHSLRGLVGFLGNWSWWVGLILVPVVLICQFYQSNFKSLSIQGHVINSVKFLSILSKIPLYVSDTCLLRH